MARAKKTPKAEPMELVLCQGSLQIIPAPMIGPALTDRLDRVFREKHAAESEDDEEATWDPIDDWVTQELSSLSDETLRLIDNTATPARRVSFRDFEGDPFEAALYPRGDLALLLFRVADTYGDYLTQVIGVCPDDTDDTWSDGAVGQALGLRVVESPIEQIRDDWTGLLVHAPRLTTSALAHATGALRPSRTGDGIVVNS